MSELGCLLVPFNVPVHMLHPIIQDWVVVSQSTQVALEVLHVYGIEAYKSSVEADIELSLFHPKDVRAAVAVSDLFESVKRCEHSR